VEPLAALRHVLEEGPAHPRFPEAIDVIGGLAHRFFVGIALVEIGNLVGHADDGVDIHEF